MRNTIILTVLLFIVAIGVAVFYFNNLNPQHKQQAENLTHIPDDAAFLISFSNDSAFYETFQRNPGFEKLLGKSFIRGLYTWYHRYLGSGELSRLTASQTFYMSFHPETKNLSVLINLPLNERMQEAQLMAFLEGAADTVVIETRQVNDLTYWELTAPDMVNQVFLHLQPRNLIISFSEKLLQHALDPQTHMLSDDIVKRINENQGNSLKLFIDHHQLGAFFDVISRSSTDNMRLFADIPAFSSMNYNPKAGTLMFSGRTFPESIDSSYLEIFAWQQPVNQIIESQLTTDVAFASFFAISDYEKFHQALEKLLDQRGELNQINEQLRLIENKKDLVIGDHLLRAIGSEFAKVTLRSGEKVGIFTVPDSLDFAHAIDTISTPIKDSSMRRFDHSNLLYYCYGDPFEEFRRPYFVYRSGFVFTSNHESTLNQYLDALEAEALLVSEPAFQTYDQLQSNRTNVSLFVHRENASNLIQLKLREPYRENFLNEQTFGYQDFYAFSLQLSGNNGELISNLYGKFSDPAPTETEEADR